ncbi:MAG: tyrosinase [bacterium]
MAAVRVRKDIWDLGDEADPWRDPAILAYARAVAAMQKLDTTDPKNGASWRNQAAIHERRAAKVPGRLENQCQHASWYFLPWHRMYLYRFEQIVRSHMPSSTAASWALPYWNYTQVAAHRVLPPAFREKKLPDGKPNPLFVTQRSTSNPNINGGDALPSAGVTTAAALAERVYTRPTPGTTSGFGGSKTGFSHSGSGFPGPLEQTPHGDVHVLVGGSGGFMSAFSTAALDPIFWLHHCNLDRLWERWLRAAAGGHPPGKNPTESAWRDRKFELVNKNGNRVKLAVKDVLDIEGQLNYTYSGLPDAQGLDELMEVGGVSEDERPAELVGATETPVTLTGTSAATSIAVSAPAGPAADRTEESLGPAPSVYLNVENIEGEANPGLLYGVYVNLPDDEPPDPDGPHFAGTMSFFGIESTATDDDEEEAPHGLRHVFDITSLAAGLSEQGRWDPEHLHVTFSPIGIEDEAASALDVPPVKIGRVSLFMQ